MSTIAPNEHPMRVWLLEQSRRLLPDVERDRYSPSLGDWLTASCSALCCVVFLLLFVGMFPSVGDLQLAMPIAFENAHPGFYSPRDLIVSAGTTGPFHTYQLATFFYTLGINVPLVWHVLYIIILWLCFLGFWRLSVAITGHPLTAHLVLAVIAIMHPLRGSLNWTWVPLPALVSATAAMPLCLFSFVSALLGGYLSAMGLAALAFVAHPGVGLIAFCTAATLMLGDRLLSARGKCRQLALGFMMMLPPVFFIVSSMFSEGAAAAMSNAAFFQQFRLYAWHAFIEDHWREGYGWFFHALAAASLVAIRRPSQARRQQFLLFALLLALPVGYAANLYTLRIPSVMLMYLFRTTYFLKPIIIALVLAGGLARLKTGFGGWRGLAAFTALGLWAGSLVLPDCGHAEVWSLAALGLWFMTGDFPWPAAVIGRTALGASVVGTCLCWGPQALGFQRSHAGESLWLILSIVTGIVSVIGAGFIAARMKQSAGKNSFVTQSLVSPPSLVSVGTVLFVMACFLGLRATAKRDMSNLMPSSALQMWQRLDFSASPTGLEPLCRFIRGHTPPGSLFAVPLEDIRFLGFRAYAFRAVYGTVFDVNQLAYTPLKYAEGHRRLERLGMRVVGRHHFDVAGYDRLTSRQLRLLHDNEKIDFVVVATHTVSLRALETACVYRDSDFSVLDLSLLPSVVVDSES